TSTPAVRTGRRGRRASSFSLPIHITPKATPFCCRPGPWPGCWKRPHDAHPETTIMNDTLTQLAQLHGIALEYRDVWGNSHPIAAETLRELLAAIGVDARDEDAVEASLEMDQRERGAGALPPTVVLRQGATPRIVLTLPENAPLGSLRWQLIDEQGDEATG